MIDNACDPKLHTPDRRDNFIGCFTEFVDQWNCSGGHFENRSRYLADSYQTQFLVNDLLQDYAGRS